MRQYSAIFWDWHGVLGLHGFWSRSSEIDPCIRKFTDAVFSSDELLASWMRGEQSFQDLVRTHAEGITQEELLQKFSEDWSSERMFNDTLFSVVSTIYPSAKHYLVTDNVDIFADYICKKPEILDLFDKMYCSSDLSALKSSTPGLFDSILSDLRLDNFTNCVLLDDSPKNCVRFKELGGETILVKKVSGR